MIPTELIRFAYFPGWYEQLDALAQMALPEPWRYRSCSAERRNMRTPVLERYLCTVCCALAIDCQNAATRTAADRAIMIRGEAACFNTGLLTRYYKPVFAYFERNKREWVSQPWYFKGWVDDGAACMRGMHPLPEKPFHGVKMDVMLHRSDDQSSCRGLLHDGGQLRHRPAGRGRDADGPRLQGSPGSGC